MYNLCTMIYYNYTDYFEKEKLADIMGMGAYMGHIIEVNQLSKSFGKVKAVNNISFYVKKGSLFSLLGTNGAGKSTTISMILTLLKKDQGQIAVNGYTVGKEDANIRKEIGVVFQESLLDSLLTVKENLDIRATFYGMKKKKRKKAISHVAEITGLKSFLNRPYGKLSGGERRRADIARALLHQPSILILDEPTTGLDAQSRKNIWKTIKQLQLEKRMTVLLTTHYIEEAGESDFVVVMNKGQIVAKGTPEQLKNKYSSHFLMINTDDLQEIETYFKSEKITYEKRESSLHLPLQDTREAIPILYKVDQYVKSFEVKQSSLDDVFLTITNQERHKNDSIH